MENSLRNHALVHQQNQQQQRNREEYYRTNGIIRSSSAMSGAPAGSANNGSIINRSRSRNSGSSTSGKSSRSTRSGEASDEAVQGSQDPLMQHTRYHHEQHHHADRQQQQPWHAHRDQQQIYQRYHQELQPQQRHPQQAHYIQYYSGDANMRIPQQPPPMQQQYQQDPYSYRGNSYNSGSQNSSSHQQVQQHQFNSSYNSKDQSSHYSNILGSISGSHQSLDKDDAYQRLGQRLSWSAHGQNSTEFSRSSSRILVPPKCIEFRSPSSSFKPFGEALQDAIRDREKLNSSSQGSGNLKSDRNLLRNVTIKANGLYRIWYAEYSRIHQRRRRKSNESNIRASTKPHNRINNHNKSDNFAMSPHQRSFAQMSLVGNNSNHDPSHNTIISASSKKQHGSLSAVIESASQNSSTATHSKNPRGSGGTGESTRSENQSRASSSIATRSSMGTRNSIRSFGTLPPRGKCLTQPSEGVSNDNNCDNSEGNLIVYENDNISVPKKQVHVLTKGKIPRGHQSSDFRIQSLLGQGTFAQVFKCLHTQTGQLVALKIIKNKPAYTRQAAVEIDVIRVANETNPNHNKKTGSTEGPLQHKSKKASSTDYMIDLVCYFMYKDHLCLAFELLGQNLYEVLKRRQFRGLPLNVTQNLVRQVVMGCKALARKSIVHCDLKPENILLVDENDEDSVMSAGDSKRLISALSSTSLDKKEQNHLHKFAAGGNDTEKAENDANSSEKNNGEASDNSKSTNETDNTTNRYKDQEQRTETTVSTNTRASPEDKMNVRTKSPMDSTIATNDVHNERIKLIDFGSACFEGQMSHTYIQSRFYRSPEVILGLAYDSAIDMWSLGCVAAELFLGLPILPGVHEHDQLVRISEMIGETPDWMLDQGTKSSKYYLKHLPGVTSAHTPPVQSSSVSPEDPFERNGRTSGRSTSEGPRPLPQWKVKTQHEYIASLTQSEIKKKGGLVKLEKQPGNRYFKRKLLSDIILHKGQSGKPEELRLLKNFIHFLYGILDPDPWKRWTAYQVISHPFFTGAMMRENVDPADIKDQNHANRLLNMYWEAPSDPTIYQRKLRSVQKTREKQQAARRGYNRSYSRSRSESPPNQDGMPTVRNALSKNNTSTDQTSTVTDHIDEAINAVARPMRQGSYQGSYQECTHMSSSMSQFGIDQGIQLLRYGSSFSGGPQSFSEAGNCIALPESFNEADFALALRRPGVVPMGDSVTTATTSTTSISSGNNSRSNYQGNIQISQVGSFGSHRVLYSGAQQRRVGAASNPRTSRSFGEGDAVPAVSRTVPTVIGSLHQQVVYASSQESGIDAVPSMVVKAELEIRADPPMEIKDDTIPKRPKSATSAKSVCEGINGEHSQKDSDTQSSFNPSVDATQKLEAFDAQKAYQQQLAAMQHQFQQQQLILQQQQAALAIQQEQLRAYYSAAGIGTHQFNLASAPTTVAAAVNTQQFGLTGTPATTTAGMISLQGNPSTSLSSGQQFTAHSTPAPASQVQHFGLSGTPGGGYYLVPAADGTQILVPASNPGAGIHMPSQVPGIAPIPGMMTGQVQRLSASGAAQLQGIAPTGLPPVGLTSQGQAIPGIVDVAAGMPVIPGLHPVGINIPAMSPNTGMTAAPPVSNNTNSSTAPPPNDGVSDTNNNTSTQQRNHRQP